MVNDVSSTELILDKYNKVVYLANKYSKEIKFKNGMVRETEQQYFKSIKKGGGA